jgi:hypothetical protein
MLHLLELHLSLDDFLFEVYSAVVGELHHLLWVLVSKHHHVDHGLELIAGSLDSTGTTLSSLKQIAHNKYIDASNVIFE